MLKPNGKKTLNIMRDDADRCAEYMKSAREETREVGEWISKTFNKAITLDQMMATTTWQSKFPEGG